MSRPHLAIAAAVALAVLAFAALFRSCHAPDRPDRPGPVAAADSALRSVEAGGRARIEAGRTEADARRHVADSLAVAAETALDQVAPVPTPAALRAPSRALSPDALARAADSACAARGC